MSADQFRRHLLRSRWARKPVRNHGQQTAGALERLEYVSEAITSNEYPCSRNVLRNYT